LFYTFEIYRLPLDGMREWLWTLIFPFISLILEKTIVLLLIEDCFLNLNRENYTDSWLKKSCFLRLYSNAIIT
jgi:hypothetical protein